MASPSFCATNRATVSVPAPGGKGTINRIGFDGYGGGWAVTMAAANAVASADS
jgi:hypothetical protein